MICNASESVMGNISDRKRHGDRYLYELFFSWGRPYLHIIIYIKTGPSFHSSMKHQQNIFRVED